MLKLVTLPVADNGMFSCFIYRFLTTKGKCLDLVLQTRVAGEFGRGVICVAFVVSSGMKYELSK